MWYLKEQEEKHPDFKVLERTISRLRNIFDDREIYHHSSNDEMFEYQIKSNDHRHEAWGIFFLGNVVASGDKFGFYDYDECQEKEYIKAIPENEEEIFQRAYRNTLAIFKKWFTYFRWADIPEDDKKECLSILSEVD